MVYKVIMDLKILCPYCNAVFTGEMEHQFDDGMGCDSCGSTDNCEIEIRCTNCEKVIYKK